MFPPAQLSNPDSSQRFRVLVVADLVDDRRRILYALDTVADVEVVGAAFSVASATQMASARRPDVMATTCDTRQDILAAFREQAEGYLVKPVDPARLQSDVAALGLNPLPR